MIWNSLCVWHFVCDTNDLLPSGGAYYLCALETPRLTLPSHQMLKGKGKGFPYSLPSIAPGADPGAYAVSPQVTISHSHGGRLPLLSARPVPATEHHLLLAGNKLYCLVKEAHRCEQLAQGCYTALPQVGFEHMNPTTCSSQVQRSTRCATALPISWRNVECQMVTYKVESTRWFQYLSHIFIVYVSLLVPCRQKAVELRLVIDVTHH